LLTFGSYRGSASKRQQAATRRCGIPLYAYAHYRFRAPILVFEVAAALLGLHIDVVLHLLSSIQSLLILHGDTKRPVRPFHIHRLAFTTGDIATIWDLLAEPYIPDDHFFACGTISAMSTYGSTLRTIMSFIRNPCRTFSPRTYAEPLNYPALAPGGLCGIREVEGKHGYGSQPQIWCPVVGHRSSGMGVNGLKVDNNIG